MKNANRTRITTTQFSNHTIVGIISAGIILYLIAAMAILTANCRTTFEWTHFGIFAFLIPFIVGFGAFTGKMIANKYYERSDIFRLSMTMATLAALVAVFSVILFVAAYFANSFPEADTMLFGIYGLVSWIAMLPSSCFASQWVNN